MATQDVQFYRYPQTTALSTFIPILRSHLPLSNPVYNRVKAPQNVPSRHCLFAATFPPASAPSETYTILFADRSRYQETHISVFNPLMTVSPPLTASQRALLDQHMLATILFLKDVQIPEAPGWPFSPILRFGCLHETLADSMVSVALPRDAIPYTTTWREWIAPIQDAAALEHKRPLPEGLTVARVPEEQLDIVLSTSTIQRQPSTLLSLPNIGILDSDGRLVAWAYVGIDGSIATLYVLPEYRDKGLATYVAKESLRTLGDGGFKNLGFDGDSGWVHAHVKDGNEGSEGVMRSIGGNIACQSRFMWVDSDKF